MPTPVRQCSVPSLSWQPDRHRQAAGEQPRTRDLFYSIFEQADEDDAVCMRSSAQETRTCPHSGRDQGFSQYLLLSDGAVPVKPAAFKEAVTDHALAKQQKDDCQDDCK
jgi:hypothetical protein